VPQDGRLHLPQHSMNARVLLDEAPELGRRVLRRESLELTVHQRERRLASPARVEAVGGGAAHEHAAHEAEDDDVGLERQRVVLERQVHLIEPVGAGGEVVADGVLALLLDEGDEGLLFLDAATGREGGAEEGDQRLVGRDGFELARGAEALAVRAQCEGVLVGLEDPLDVGREGPTEQLVVAGVRFAREDDVAGVVGRLGNAAAGDAQKDFEEGDAGEHKEEKTADAAQPERTARRVCL